MKTPFPLPRVKILPARLVAGLGIAVLLQTASAQISSIVFYKPSVNQIINSSVTVEVQVTSTFELQSVQASVTNRTVALTYTGAANYWTNSLSLAGLPQGSKTLTVAAVDIFGNSNQAQRTIIFDTPPTEIVSSPTNGSVMRATVPLNVTSADDGPTPPVLEVMQALDYTGGPILASGAGSMQTSVFLADGQVASLFFRARDSANQIAGRFRVVYLLATTNLVEVARVSDGEISDVQSDRVLFQSVDNNSLAPGAINGQTRFRLMTRSRLNGSEATIYEDFGTNLGAAYLAPQGAAFVVSIPPLGYANGSRFYQSQNGVLIEHGMLGLASIPLAVKGRFALWQGWLSSGYAGLHVYLTDLVTTNTYLVPDASWSPSTCDFSANGDVVFIPQTISPGHIVSRYRGGVVTQLSSDFVNTDSYPKIDGSGVCYLKTSSTNQSLMLIAGGVETKVADGVAIGTDFQINNGWIAYTRNGGSGTMQVWRRSPGGDNSQLSFFGSSSKVAALAPNGEVAFYNGLHLYLSKGTWPPVDVTVSPTMLFNYITPSLNPFWQDGRWLATLGGSLFQLHTGSPRITGSSRSNGQFRIEVMAAAGQRVVAQSSSNFVDWTDFATNDVSDNANLGALDPKPTDPKARYFRLRLQ